ncbi:ComEA family DNA-binding protein [Umezawaea beigongshangensis]|uniref:ComEA family DNA-binding protein n=1 Tax=Umezawaea beigongshangensis TaxID=2780383 RepID=UPI0018F16B62|nr:ComEA family DNA-binding protein [Umezawaea beigongshangensis]
MTDHGRHSDTGVPQKRLSGLATAARSSTSDDAARDGPTVVFASAADSDGPGAVRHARPGAVRRHLDRLLHRWWSPAAGRSRVLLVGTVVVLAGLTALLGPWRQHPEPERPPDLLAPARAAPSPVAQTAASVVVDVVGEVSSPGLVTLTGGARVADALARAGGARPGTDLHGLNLARKVADGEQIAVGVPPPADRGRGTGGDQRVDLNAADEGELDALPGVGPVTAQRIVRWRTEHGPFVSVEQLREVDGIGENKFARLADLVRV